MYNMVYIHHHHNTIDQSDVFLISVAALIQLCWIFHICKTHQLLIEYDDVIQMCFTEVYTPKIKFCKSKETFYCCAIDEYTQIFIYSYV